MGVVYRAEQISTRRDVAVKVMFPHLAKNPRVLERFETVGRLRTFFVGGILLPLRTREQSQECQ